MNLAEKLSVNGKDNTFIYVGFFIIIFRRDALHSKEEYYG